MYKTIFCLSFFLINLLSYSQSNSYQLNIHIGRVVKNYPVFPPSSISSLIELRWQQQLLSQWSSFYRYPKLGLTSVFSNYGNEKELGFGIGLMPQLTFNVRKKYRIPLWLTFGWGYSYITKKYDPYSNPINTAVSTNITNMACFSAMTTINLSNKFKLNVGISTLHFSNGHYRMPNNGINIPSLVLGLQFGKDSIFSQPEKQNFNLKKIFFIVQAGTGLHDFGDGSKPIGGPLYPVYALTTGIAKQVNSAGKIHLGIYVNYYTDYYDYIVEKMLFKTSQTAHAMTGTIYLGYEFLFGKFSFMVQSGLYAWNPFYKYYKNTLGENDFKTFLKKFINNKMGLQFYPFAKHGVQKGIYLGSYIRANFGQADFSEFAFGYSF